MKIKKYILLLIFVLLLTFTLVGNCAWLSGYDQRIKLTVDSSKIDSALSDFPVTVFFTSTQAEEIFAEFDADSDYMKCAFTSSDGTTQLYAEKELFDDSESKAIYHVKVTSVSSSADTDIYYYYDNDASDNTTYIGAINTTAGGHVWDSNFKAVYHMTDATTSTVVDSTSNSNDGTKKAANEPIEAAGKVGQAQDFDGTDDYIDCGTDNSLDLTEITLEALIKPDTVTGGYDTIIAKREIVSPDYFINYQFSLHDDEIVFYFVDSDNNHHPYETTDANLLVDTWYHVIATFSSTNNSVKIYVNGVEKLSETENADLTANIYPLALGRSGGYGDGEYFNGIIDEPHISDTARSAAWIKATYNSLWDSLLTYSSEETKPSGDNAVMFGINF